MRTILLCLVLSVLTGCSSVATQGPPPRANASAPAEGSLFATDAEALTDEQIRRILGTSFELAPPARLALLHLDHRVHPDAGDLWWSSRRVVTSGQELLREATQRLREHPDFYDVSYLPTFLLPADRTIARVREAAARYQADVVLVFQTEVRPYGRQSLFSAELAKAECRAECALLDTRTGIIPFTSRATREVVVAETEDEWSLQQTVDRAAREAVEAAMLENAENLVTFLGARRAP